MSSILILSQDVIDALGFTPANAADRNAANGLAPLDAGSLVPPANLPKATTLALGAVRVDGTTITIDGNGIISSAGGGGSVDLTSINAALQINGSAFNFGGRSDNGGGGTENLYLQSLGGDVYTELMARSGVANEDAASLYFARGFANGGYMQVRLPASGTFQIVSRADPNTHHVRVSPPAGEIVLGLRLVTMGETLGMPYDIGGGTIGKPNVNEKIVNMAMTRDIFFPANFAGSRATADAAATASTVFTINKKDGGGTTQIGTITFAIGATTGTFASTGGTTQSLDNADTLFVTAPASPDDTLSDISITLKGAS